MKDVRSYIRMSICNKQANEPAKQQQQLPFYLYFHCTYKHLQKLSLLLVFFYKSKHT